MASTYVNDLRLNEMATGDASGSWGTVTNTNLELIGEAFSYGTETIGDADSTLTIADGASDPVRSFFLKITSSVDLTTTRIVTIAPNTVSKVWMIENATTGSQVITIKQGSGATINVPNGQVKMLATDGAGSGGAVLDLLVDVDLTGTTTLVNLDVSGAVDIAGDLTLSAGGDGALRFTAASSVKVLDNDAAALVFEEADNAYMTFVTTDGSEAVKFDKALDINAATQIDATVTVGVDDTGYDVKFFGATAGAYMLWDESADTLEVSGTIVAAAGTALLPSITTTGDLNTGMWFPAADTIAFSEGGVEALRIDSSGNVLVGATSNAPTTTAGINLGSNNKLHATRDSGSSGYFNRLTNDGAIVEFAKDGTTVGSIGALSSRLYIGTAETGLFFNNSSGAITPFDVDGLTQTDADVDLGAGTVRFKDLYLSGGVYLGGAVAANLLDDYEEGTWTPVIADANTGGNVGSATMSNANYTKVGNKVTVAVQVVDIVTTGMTGGSVFYVRGLPFLSASQVSYGACWPSSINFQSTRTGVVVLVSAADTWATFQQYGDSISATSTDVNDITSGTSDMNFSITYFT
jgi:hypothetical protein